MANNPAGCHLQKGLSVNEEDRVDDVIRLRGQEPFL